MKSLLYHHTGTIYYAKSTIITGSPYQVHQFPTFLSGALTAMLEGKARPP